MTTVAEAVGIERQNVRRTVGWAVVAAAAVGLAAFVLVAASRGVASDPRLANPGGGPRPHPPLWGVDNWPFVFSLVFLVVSLTLFGTLGWLSWRQRKVHYALPVFFAVAGLSWLDPPANWVTFTVFDPRFLHFPTTWGFMRLAPLVEPVTNVPGYPMYYFTVALVGFAIATRLLRRSGPDGRMTRHPLWSVFGVTCAIAFVWDLATELFMIRADMYHYSQAWGPRLSIGQGRFPLVWGFFTWFSIAVAAVLLHRDDHGRPLLARLSARSGRASPSILRQTVAGIVVMSLAYCVPLGFYGFLRVANLTSANDRWPYTESKVYDPYGKLAEHGVPGPYYK